MKTIRNTKGFTLVEMLVAITVFSVVVVMAIGSFLAIVRVNSRSVGAKNIQQDARYVIERIAHDVRSGSIDYSRNDDDDSTLHLITRDGKRIEYEWRPGLLGLEESGDLYIIYDGGSESKVNSEKINISNMKFLVFPETSQGASSEQPRATIIGEFKNRDSEAPSVLLQTTIVSREYLN